MKALQTSREVDDEEKKQIRKSISKLRNLLSFPFMALELSAGINEDPDQLLRVCVGLGFKRARLQYVYSILRGKDLDTEQFSEERRVEQFGVLKQAQDRVLDLTYWHDFMKAVRQAGFCSMKMISSQNNLLFSYILYLVGRTKTFSF